MISFSIDKQRGQVNAEWMSRPVDSIKKSKNNQPLVLVLTSMEQSPTFASRLKRNFYLALFSGELTLSHIDISRKSILVDRSGTIWIGTHGGIFLYDPSADSRGDQSFSLFKQLATINVAGIMEDRSGSIWVASSTKGVFRYDGKIITNIAGKEELGENYAGGIAQDKAGNMWFTMKNGICKYDGRTFTEYTAKDGLGGTEFWGIYIEQSGIIWVTTRGSTTRFDPSIPLPNPKAFTVFTSANGLTCCVQSMYQDKSGNMWWGTGQGLYRFDGKRFYQVKQNGPW